MRLRYLKRSLVLSAALVLGGCGGGNGPSAGFPLPSFSAFAAELIAMVTGPSCDTATPIEINSLNISENDQGTQDANTVNLNCS